MLSQSNGRIAPRFYSGLGNTDFDLAAPSQPCFLLLWNDVVKEERHSRKAFHCSIITSGSYSWTARHFYLVVTLPLVLLSLDKRLSQTQVFDA